MWVHYVKDMKRRAGFVKDTIVVNGITTFILMTDGTFMEIAANLTSPLGNYVVYGD